MNTVQKSFCTTSEAANRLGVSVGTVQMWVESGLLPAWKTAGGHRRVLQDGIDQLLRKPAVLDAPTAPTVPTATATPSEPHEDRLKVLVVEDDPSLLRLYQFHLSRWPMSPRLHIVSNAFAALLMMGREPPDLLISDLHMPGMDGFTMLKVLCEAPALKGTRIVVVSGLSPADVAARGGLPQGIEVLPKPIPFDQLLNIANAVLITKKSQPPRAQDTL